MQNKQNKDFALNKKATLLKGIELMLKKAIPERDDNIEVRGNQDTDGRNLEVHRHVTQ